MHFLTLLVLLASTARAAIDPENFQRALSQIQDLARQAVNSSNVHVPGLSIAVVYNGSVQYTGGFGVREIGFNDSVSADTVFRLASMSKPVSSTIVAAMVSASNLTWTSKTNVPNNVAQYSDPWISAELTIADGFSHRSGLYPRTYSPVLTTATSHGPILSLHRSILGPH
jgi:CubicO group peptidase (beta-lactamase class C family)